MKKHFVTFYSPGTFFDEETTKPIDSWDVETAKQMAKSISERYGAKPFGFVFSTRSRSAEELDSKEIKHSGIYYLPHCRVETREEVERRNAPNEEILRSNMRINEIEAIVTTDIGWKFAKPLRDGDTVLTQ